MDGAGIFYFSHVNKRGWVFNFKIVQSINNLRLLYYCKSNLGVGSVTERVSERAIKPVRGREAYLVSVRSRSNASSP